MSEEVVASPELIASISSLVSDLQTSFRSQITRSYEWRLRNLKAFKKMLEENLDMISFALRSDLNEFDYQPHLLDCLREVEFMISNLKKLMKSKCVTSEISWINFPASGEIVPEPLGTVLIVGTWNYPFHSALGPLPGAIAAGNTVLIKPGSLCRESSQCIRELVRRYFNPKEIACVEGGIEVMNVILSSSVRFDHVFFTGGSNVGRIVMEAAAKNLTPVTLELGGKNPCIVTASADIKLAARRIAWGKWFTNAGQVCIAPDHLVVDESVADKLIEELSDMITEFFPLGPKDDNAYCRIISKSHTDRLMKIIEGDEKFVVKKFGGVSRNDRLVPPTILDFQSDWESFKNSAAMNAEIFGPILPIIRYKTTEECSEYLSSLGKTHGSPLVMYVFSNESANSISKNFLSYVSSGGVVINDCGIHIAEGCLPFGGIGKSGIGKYHNGKTFEIFTHSRSVLWKTGYLDVPFRYPPIGPVGAKLMTLLLWASRKNITPIRVAKSLIILGLLYKILRR